MKLLKYLRENDLHYKVENSLRLSWGNRFHFPASFFWLNVGGKKEFVLGFLLLELRLYIAPPKHTLTKEQVFARKEKIFISHMQKREEESTKKLAKKLKISEVAVEQLAISHRYIVENGRILRL